MLLLNGWSWSSERVLRVLSQHSTLAESAGPPSAATLAFLPRPDENRRTNGGGLTISIAACMPCAMTRSPSLLPLPPPSLAAWCGLGFGLEL